MPFKLKSLINCPFTKSRLTNKDKNKNKSKNNFGDNLDFIAGYNEDPDLILMRKTIEKNPEIFILNNLMMCVQFFRNFDEEIHQIRQTLVSARETQFNVNLLPQKRALLPDVLQEHIARNLKFTSARQTLRPTIEPLQPIRVYVVHENFEIAEDNDPHHYTSMNEVFTYNLRLKASEHKGYVYLQHLGTLPIKRNQNEDELCSIAEKSDEVYDKCIYEEKSPKKLTKSYSSRSLPESLNSNVPQTELRKSLYSTSKDMKLDSLYYEKLSSSRQRVQNSRKQSHRLSQKPFVMKQRVTSDSPASSTSSGYVTSGVDSDSDYGYSGINLNELTKTAELPNSCFKMITYTQSGKMYDPHEDRRQNLTSKQKRIKDELRRYNYNVWYIHNASFMRHFFKTFKQQLAYVLGFDEAAVSDAKCLGSVIYCDKIDVFGSSAYTKVEPYEVIPSVWSQWPECAQEWLARERSVWPDFEVIQKIKEFGCYMVPECFIPRQESNSMRKIEWQLTFPAAERYLETNLSHAQTKVLLIALMLHKTFVRPMDTLLGLSTSHIKNKLFWLIEQNGPFNWPEHRTGECLLKLFATIYQCISQNTPLMKDYFMRDKNLFQNIPNECLLQSQKQINRILTNPIMYLIYAMENIHHKQSFFPKLDFDELLRILTTDIIALVNPQLVQNNKLFPKISDYNYSMDCNTSSSFWENDQKRNEYISIPRKPVTNKTLINTKAITKNPIIEISVRCAEMEDIRLSLLLDFFIRHFIQTAQRYHQYGAWKLKAVFIAQAERLCVLLSEKDSCEGNARIYMQKINVLKNLVIKIQTSTEAPETPKRNSDKPFYSTSLKDRFAQDPEYEQMMLDKISEVQSDCYLSDSQLNNLNETENALNRSTSVAEIHVQPSLKKTCLKQSSQGSSYEMTRI